MSIQSGADYFFGGLEFRSLEFLGLEFRSLEFLGLELRV